MRAEEADNSLLHHEAFRYLTHAALGPESTYLLYLTNLNEQELTAANVRRWSEMIKIVILITSVVMSIAGTLVSGLLCSS